MTMTADAAPGSRCPRLRSPRRAAQLREVEQELAALRRTPGLAVDWATGPTPRDWCRTVAALAMGGVPILAQPLPLWARRFLDPTLAATLVAPVALDDLLDREVLFA